MSITLAPRLSRRHFIGAASVGLLASPSLVGAGAGSAPPEVASNLPGARRIGQARLRFMGLAIYDASLWSPDRLGPDDWSSAALAIELVYARSLAGARIAERSLVEMRRQGTIDEPTAERWLALMRSTFPDVNAGDRLTGVHRPGDAASFHFNGRLLRTWDDRLLARQFFGIWLAPQTSEPALREALFGGRG